MSINNKAFRDTKRKRNRLFLLAAAFLLILTFSKVFLLTSSRSTANLAAFVLDDQATLWEELPLREEEWSVWDGTIDKELDGSGDIANPFLIRTAAQLAGWGVLVDEGRVDSFARLMTNIDLNELEWTPISRFPHNSTTPWNIYSNGRFFCGYFDGNGYIIKNLRIIEKTTNSSFFYRTDHVSYIANCSILNAHIQTESRSGILVGTSAGGIGNCHVFGVVNGARVLGGMIGRSHGGLIRHSHASAHILGIFDRMQPTVIGGFVGIAEDYFYRFVNCRATGRIVAENGREIGGFVGSLSSLRLTPPPQSRTYYNENLGVWNSISSVDVVGREDIGGFVGSSSTNTNIINCLSLGNVTGGLRTGGFAGYNRCYLLGNSSSGFVSGDERTGGFIGVNSGPPQTGFRYSQTGNREFLRNIGKVVSCRWLQNETVNIHLEGIGVGVTEGKDVDLDSVSDPGQIRAYNWDQPYAFKPQQYRDAEIVFMQSGESKKLFLDTGGDVPKITSIKPRKIEGVSITYEDNCLTLNIDELHAPVVHIVSIGYKSASGEKVEKRFRFVLR